MKSLKTTLIMIWSVITFTLVFTFLVNMGCLGVKAYNMLDFDLAELIGVESDNFERTNRAIKRNAMRGLPRAPGKR